MPERSSCFAKIFRKGKERVYLRRCLVYLENQCINVTLRTNETLLNRLLGLRCMEHCVEKTALEQRGRPEILQWETILHECLSPG